MSAASPLETLRAIGIEAICAQTHIAPANVKALLEGEFERFSAVQFNGFVTIIEREFDLDLIELRTQFSHLGSEPNLPFSVQEHDPSLPFSEKDNDPFAIAVKDKKKQRIGIAVLSGLLLIVIVVTFMVLGGKGEERKIELNNTAIEQAKANMAKTAIAPSEGTRAEVEAIQESHQSEAAETVLEPETVHYDDVIIRPNSMVWLGVIDTQTHKRLTRTTSEPWRLDGSKEWLIVTGHGLLSLECGGVNASFSQPDRLLFLYEGGQCRQIDAEEFKARNQGRVW